MARYRTINVDLNRQYRNDLNANFAQIEQDIIGQENFTVEMKDSLLTELARIEQESIDRDNTLARQNLEVLLQSIEDAKANANTAASNANTKANYAQTQGDYAKNQGDYAKSQGDYAQTKGDYADEKAVLADEAASNANLEASNLSQLKIDVVTATQNANTATSNTNQAITNAEFAANYAQTQGDYAKTQGDAAKEVVENAPVVSVNGQKGVVNLTANDVDAIPSTEKGMANGVAKLNASGKVVDASGNEVEGKVKSVNNVQPDTNGNITIDIPEPDLSGYATNENLNAHISDETIHTTQAEKDKLAGIETGANKYTHPSTHPASMIAIADTSNLFTASNVEGALSELFTNVSNGKNQIATAITDKGVSASGSDTFSQLANKIRQIITGVDTSDATAYAHHILSGYTAYARGTKIKGTAVKGVKFATGTSSPSSGNGLQLSGFGFEPNFYIGFPLESSGIKGLTVGVKSIGLGLVYYESEGAAGIQTPTFYSSSAIFLRTRLNSGSFVGFRWYVFE